MKITEIYLHLKQPSVGPFFKSILAEINFIIYMQMIILLHKHHIRANQQHSHNHQR